MKTSDTHFWNGVMVSQDRGALRVLIVEDSPTQARKLKRLLEQQKFQVEVACDGQQGLEALTERQFDLVLSDVRMPNLDGYELCRKIRADPSTRHIPFILISSLQALSDKATGFECGADLYIGKPYDPAELLGHIAKLLAGSSKRPGPTI